MGNEARRSKEMEIRRNDIIAAAEVVFFSKGYERSTMDDVARQAEFSKRTLYAYFSSKEQLYFEMMIRGYRQLKLRLQQVLQTPQALSAEEELWAIAHVYYVFSCEQPEHFQAIMEYENRPADFQNGIPDASRDECYALGEEALQFVKTALDKGIRDGDFRADLAPEQAAVMLWASILGIFSTVRIKKNYIESYYNISPGEFVRQAFLFLLRSLKASGHKNEG
ncbi:TetR/AcrR family transcriptional regulator [Paenibacillus sp. NFR01]|uniref:TetR/AcrR family transcriptional regulator n=1 Tax=Paenibacillus sp. NFR01 TaxID=1566279 RepID=UPI0008CDD6CB|nr:TetR/AcrR family transcriptional regulator [Paenibacillus sp. NFR01]SET60260.1 transcriptional regulator, TetR family [Paenibacillus sp. NFR01]